MTLALRPGLRLHGMIWINYLFEWVGITIIRVGR